MMEMLKAYYLFFGEVECLMNGRESLLLGLVPSHTGPSSSSREQEQSSFVVRARYRYVLLSLRVDLSFSLPPTSIPLFCLYTPEELGSEI